MTATKIKVNVIETEYQLTEDCPLNQPWEFECKHSESHQEETSYTYAGGDGEPIEVNGFVEVCDECSEVVEDL